MLIAPAELDGVFVLHLDVAADERGTFTRTFDREVLSGAGMSALVAQAASSSNTLAGTLRGLHFQVGAHAENKTVRCSRGRLFDVVADVRPGSATFGRWQAFELDAATPLAVYVPAGCAHGYLTLAPETEVAYTMDTAYASSAASGIRYDDPVLAIEWPRAPVVISERDRSLPFLDPGAR